MDTDKELEKTSAVKCKDIVTLLRTVQCNIEKFDEAVVNEDLTRQLFRSAVIDLQSVLDYAVCAIWLHFTSASSTEEYRIKFPTSQEEVVSTLNHIFGSSTGFKIGVEAEIFMRFKKVLIDVQSHDWFVNLTLFRNHVTHREFPKVVLLNTRHAKKEYHVTCICTKIYVTEPCQTLLRNVYDYVCTTVSVLLYEARLIDSAELCLYNLETNLFTVHCEQSKFIVHFKPDGNDEIKPFEKSFSTDSKNTALDKLQADRENAALELLNKVQGLRSPSKRIFNYRDCKQSSIPTIALPINSSHKMLDEFKEKLDKLGYSSQWEVNAFSQSGKGDFKLTILRQDKMHFMLSGNAIGGKNYSPNEIIATATKEVITMLHRYSFIQFIPRTVKLGITSAQPDYSKLFNEYKSKIRGPGWECKLISSCNTYITIHLSQEQQKGSEQVQWRKILEMINCIRTIDGQPSILGEEFLNKYSPLKKYANECIAKYIAAGFQSSKTCMFCVENEELISNAVSASPTTKDGRTIIYKLLQIAKNQVASQSICTAHTGNILTIRSGVKSSVTETSGGDPLNNLQSLEKLNRELETFENITGWKEQLDIAKRDLTDLEQLLQSMCSNLEQGHPMKPPDSIKENITKTCECICNITHTYISTQQLVQPINEMISKEIRQNMIKPIQDVLKETFTKCDIEDDELFAISIQCLESGDQDKNIIMRLQSIGFLEIST